MEMIVSFARKFHQTIVLVTHDPEMERYADRVVRLLDGRIVSNQVRENQNTDEAVRGKEAGA